MSSHFNPSTNRHASMKANCNGKEQIFSNFTINFANKLSLIDFTNHLTRQTKSAPDCPEYEFDQIKMKLGGKFIELTEENYSNIRDLAFQGNEKLILMVKELFVWFIHFLFLGNCT